MPLADAFSFLLKGVHGSGHEIDSSGTGDQTRSGVPGGTVVDVYVQCVKMYFCFEGAFSLRIVY